MLCYFNKISKNAACAAFAPPTPATYSTYAVRADASVRPLDAHCSIKLCHCEERSDVAIRIVPTPHVHALRPSAISYKYRFIIPQRAEVPL